ncbi:hypothetical protein CLU81_1251 [Flavobacterium sp. 9]|uniref:hypothetical protein n=1 Tax=Flavobacterium sp. 9 TaxID=2035198 RepID=UPI000C1942FA|nr:hypothetical protein [Flavobacterium sp. 9]PIF30801.1 hypothetical protein CLU81_1251 [Flavobacterium sp. 9]
MKNLFTMGACALLSLTIFSCTADEFETGNKDKAPEVKKASMTDMPPSGPGDDPIIVPPPPKKP